MPMKEAAVPGHVAPGIRIHAIDISQPPGIGTAPIADIDSDHAAVRTAHEAKSSAEVPKKVCCEARFGVMVCSLLSRIASLRLAHDSPLAVLVVAFPPCAGLVTSLWGPIKPLVHSPDRVDSACIGGIGVVDHPVL